MSIDEIKSSGLLELYVIGDLSQEEIALVEQAMDKDESIRTEISEIEKALESYALAHAIKLPETHKPMFLAVVNFTDRLQKGEVPVSPPSLSAQSKISDFSQWLEREDMQEPEEYDSMHGKIIDSNEEKTTIILWLKDRTVDETHTNEFEKFLIVEGTCNITIGDKVHSLKAGDFLAIPLFINHRVEVTSSYRCKVILERAAA